MVGRLTLVGGAGNRIGFDSLALCQKNNSINTGGEHHLEWGGAFWLRVRVTA